MTTSSGGRLPRWARRARRSQTMTAATLAALFAASACGQRVPSPQTVPTADSETTTTSTASTTSSSTATAEAPTTASTTPRSVSTTSSTTSTTSTTSPMNGCTYYPDGTTGCVVSGRPLRGRWRRRRLLLPLDTAASGDDGQDARTEYASVASFGELALRLIAVGAPVELVEACHVAALDEIRHARTEDALGRRSPRRFGPIPELLGRRIGGLALTRRRQLRRIAVESFVDGWRNESMAAAILRQRADEAATPEDRAALLGMADDERGHADLARRIVEWCFAEEPDAVGRALVSVG